MFVDLLCIGGHKRIYEKTRIIIVLHRRVRFLKQDKGHLHRTGRLFKSPKKHLINWDQEKSLPAKNVTASNQYRQHFKRIRVSYVCNMVRLLLVNKKRAEEEKPQDVSAHPQFCTCMSFMMKPSRASSSLVALPSTITHLFSYESSSSAEPVLPSTEKPCEIQPFRSNLRDDCLRGRRFRSRDVTTGNRRRCNSHHMVRLERLAICIRRFRQYSAGHYCCSYYSIYCVRCCRQSTAEGRGSHVVCLPWTESYDREGAWQVIG